MTYTDHSTYAYAKLHSKMEDGTEIRITDTGRFVAQVGNRYVGRASLSALKAILNAADHPLHCMQVNGVPYGTRPVELISTSGGKTQDVQGKKYSRYESLYLYDAEAVEKLDRLQEEYRRLEMDHKAIVAQLTRVNADNFKTLADQAAAEEGTPDE